MQPNALYEIANIGNRRHKTLPDAVPFWVAEWRADAGEILFNHSGDNQIASLLRLLPSRKLIPSDHSNYCAGYIDSCNNYMPIAARCSEIPAHHSAVRLTAVFVNVPAQLHQRCGS
jgi:hypothetical protein